MPPSFFQLHVLQHIENDIRGPVDFAIILRFDRFPLDIMEAGEVKVS